MVAYVMVDGKPMPCRAKDPTHCPYHRNADGSQMLHYSSEEAVYNEVERLADRKHRLEKHMDMLRRQEQIKAKTGRPDPNLMKAIQNSARGLNADAAWDRAVKKLHSWAGFTSNIYDPTFKAHSKGDYSVASRETALHEAAHAIMDLESGADLASIRVGYDDGKLSEFRSIGLTSAKTGSSTYEGAWAAFQAGRQIDEAFNVPSYSWGGDDKITRDSMDEYFKANPNEVDSPVRRNWLIKQSHIDAREMLAKRVDAVIALADKVLREQEVDGASAKRMLDKYGVRLRVPAPALPPRPRKIAVKPPLPPRPVPTVKPDLPPRPKSETKPVSNDGNGDLRMSFDEMGRLRPVSSTGRTNEANEDGRSHRSARVGSSTPGVTDSNTASNVRSTVTMMDPPLPPDSSAGGRQPISRVDTKLMDGDRVIMDGTVYNYAPRRRRSMEDLLS